MFSFLATIAGAQSIENLALLPEDHLPELKVLLGKAAAQSPRTLEASFEVARLRAYEMVESSQMWPSVNANLNWAGVQSSIDGDTTVKSRNSGLFYTLSVYQPIFHWGALKAQSDIGKLRTAVGEQRYTEAYRSLALLIRTQYLDLIQRKKAWIYGQATLQQSESRFAALRQRFQAGAISQAELNEPQLRLAETRIATDRLAEAFEQGCRTLAALCGVEAITADQVPDEYPKPVVSDEKLATLYGLGSSFDPTRTPQGAINEIELRENQLNYKIARSRTLPKLGFSASASEQNSTTALSGSLSQQNVSQQQIGVSVNWAIFDGFAARGTKMGLLEDRRRISLRISEFDRTQRERLGALEKQIGFAARSLEVSEARLSNSNNSVAVVTAEVKSGHSSPDGLETVQSLARTTELTTLSYRAELFARVAEYLSILGIDPMVAQAAQTR